MTQQYQPHGRGVSQSQSVATTQQSQILRQGQMGMQGRTQMQSPPLQSLQF